MTKYKTVYYNLKIRPKTSFTGFYGTKYKKGKTYIVKRKMQLRGVRLLRNNPKARKWYSKNNKITLLSISKYKRK
jgi:hypothetical protein